MTDGNGSHRVGHLLFVWSPTGWTLRQREGEAPPVGAAVEEGERRLVITKVGPSPLPGDRRRCAYTHPG